MQPEKDFQIQRSSKLDSHQNKSDRRDSVLFESNHHLHTKTNKKNKQLNKRSNYTRPDKKTPAQLPVWCHAKLDSVLLPESKVTQQEQLEVTTIAIKLTT